MIFKSADLPVSDNNDFMKFQFPYANFKSYTQEEKLTDISSIVSKLKEDSAHGNDWKELRNKLRETFGILNSLNLDSDKSQPISRHSQLFIGKRYRSPKRRFREESKRND